MKVFLTHTFQTALSQEYYDFVREVMEVLYNNHHEIFLGGLLDNISDSLKKYSDAITCYSVEPY